MKAGTPNHIKTKRLQRALKIKLYEACGILELLWLQTAQTAPTGDIGKLSNFDIACVLDWEGDADELVLALVDSGWLDEHPDHRLVVHDWHEHCPNYVAGNLSKHHREFATGDRAKQPAKHGANEPAKDGAKQGANDAASDGATKPNQSKPILVNPNQAKKECPPAADEPPVVAESLSESDSAKEPKPEQFFPDFFSAYPRHIARKEAEKAYVKALPSIAKSRGQPMSEAAEWLLERAKLYARSPAGNAGTFTKHPASWLNAGRYDDDEREWLHTDKTKVRQDQSLDKYRAPNAGNM